MPTGKRPRPAATVAEEVANSVTHGIGIVLAIAALAILIAFSALWGDAWHIVACAVFGTSLILLYTASTLYHAIPHPRAKRVLRILDHGAIFLLIAGTYTPFTLVSLRGPWGWSLFGVIWGAAILGVVLEATPLRRYRAISITLYLVLGWIVLIAVKPMLAAVARGGLVLLFAGGLCYTVGLVFYAWRRLPFNHAAWHLFVLAGSTLHFFSILYFVVLPGG